MNTATLIKKYSKHMSTLPHDQRGDFAICALMALEMFDNDQEEEVVCEEIHSGEYDVFNEWLRRQDLSLTSDNLDRYDLEKAFLLYKNYSDRVNKYPVRYDVFKGWMIEAFPSAKYLAGGFLLGVLDIPF